MEESDGQLSLLGLLVQQPECREGLGSHHPVPEGVVDHVPEGVVDHGGVGVVVSFSNWLDTAMDILFRWGKGALVNFLICDCLFSSLSFGEDTSHHPMPEGEYITTRET